MTLALVLAYFCVLFAISRLTARRATNDTFFRGERRSPWWLVAFGMVGASISGVTFVSVPGMVLTSNMAYLQLCIGFIFGYLAVAFVLLPVYYKLNLTSVYSYLGQRLGHRSYKTGAWFFLLSKMCGAALKFYVVCMILGASTGSGGDWGGLRFVLVTVVMVMLIWLYTRQGGIRTLVFTDTFQTLCLFTALGLIIYEVMGQMDFSLSEAVRAVAADERSRVFVMDDWASPWNFWKQLLSGLFIVVVMTGLDQDMMQKNLTCKSLRDAQKDMCTYGLAFLPANFLFLALGVLLAQYFEAQGIALPAKGDELLPMFVQGDEAALAGGSSLFTLHSSLFTLFLIGILAASFSSADSALTSLTTSYCVDICQRENDERLRRRVHVVMCVCFAGFILLFNAVNSKSLIDAIYTIVSYTYGPLLGLFVFGLFTKREVRDRFVPYVCVASPLLCYAIDTIAKQQFGYHFGYELLLLNGLLTFLGLLLLRRD
ncbi:MAG: sodium:solute symporter [Prevotella sp.]|nr:sodium:solute symporter [Prevotella sp.]